MRPLLLFWQVSLLAAGGESPQSGSVTVRAPALPGQPLSEVDTPALLVDADALERNLARMADAAAEFGIRLRPHAKTHKSPIIAEMQIAKGAVGVCCQKVSEAEVLVEAGIGDVLVSNEVVGRDKLERLAALAGRAKIAVCVDDARNTDDLAAAAQSCGVTLDVLVEIDVGAHRCGTSPGAEAVALARRIAGTKHVRFAGLQAYHGAAQHLRTPGEREDAIAQAAALTRATVVLLKRAGLAPKMVSGAGTGTFELEAASGVWNELQAGSYIFMDADYARNTRNPARANLEFEHALFVYVTVMSTPSPERAVVDAGHKALANDSGPPTVWGLAEARYHRPSDEHGILDVGGAARRPALGEKLLLVPGHCDPTVNLHDWYVAVRGLHTPQARVEALWPVAARGAIF